MESARVANYPAPIFLPPRAGAPPSQPQGKRQRIPCQRNNAAEPHIAKLALSYYISARQELTPLPGENGPEEALKGTVRAAFAAAVDYVQVREKDLPARRLLRLMEELAATPEKQNSRLLVNERLDVARCCRADGVHLPSDSLPIRAVRSWAGAPWIVGISCHGEQEVEQAAEAGADYVLLGPVFETPSKPGAQPLGLSRLQEICRRSSISVFALGGVNLTNAAECVRAGAAGIAGIRLFQQARDLAAVCGHLRSL